MIILWHIFYSEPPQRSPLPVSLQCREVFLGPAKGSYSRNLYSDFLSIPDFVDDGASVVSVEFLVQEHGDATLDKLVIKDVASSTGTVNVTKTDLVGICAVLILVLPIKRRNVCLMVAVGWVTSARAYLSRRCH